MHRWVGLFASLIGMLVFFSGAVATFHEEIDSWASRGERTVAVSAVPGFSLDAAVAKAAEGVPEAYRHQVDIRQGEGRPLFLFFHEHDNRDGTIQERGVAKELDPASLEVLAHREGDRQAVFADSPIHQLARFFIELHIFLLMPRNLGLTAVGVTGFALMVLICTGTLVHRPTAAKLFRWPRGLGRRGFGDLHTLVGLWTLPYTAILALTGTFFAFAGTVLIPVIAMVAFGGDQEELVRTVIGEVEVSESAEVATLDPIYADAMARSGGAELEAVGLDQWTEPGANATVSLVRRSTLGDTRLNYVYDGHTGEFLFERPSLGRVPSLGGTLVQLMGDLHFGTLLGFVTKVLWGLFGLATCALAGAGLTIYVLRQPEDRWGTRFVRVMTILLGGGVPLASAATALAWVAGCAAGLSDVEPVMTMAFLATLVLSGGLGGLRSFTAAMASAWAVTGIGLIGLVIAAPLATGLSLPQVWADTSLRETLWMDGTLVVLGGILVAIAIVTFRMGRQAQPVAPKAESGADYDDLPDAMVAREAW
ncbi:MAG: PepSY-associated TM helix domain-containing protein [Myxococcota bacterium]